MSEKRIFEVGYIEYPQITRIYRSIKINVSNYPELEGKSDDEITKYIKENASEMQSACDGVYDSLDDELSNQPIIREVVPHIGSEIWAVAFEGADVESDDSDSEDDDYED